MNPCPFLESLSSLFRTGKCEGECPLSKLPPSGHLIIGGAVALVLVVLFGAIFARPRR